MTDTLEDTTAVDADTSEESPEGETAEQAAARKERERDFTKFRPNHQELADFVNANDKFKEAGLDPVTPNQVKAILALRSDFSKQPELVAAREAAKAEKAAKEARFAGLSEEQKEKLKESDRETKKALKLREKADAAIKLAEELAAAATGDGASLLAAEVAESVESTPEPEQAEEAPKRSRRR